ncbi:MAG: hypothetical protein ABEH81_07655 [Halopenitus sp.]
MSSDDGDDAKATQSDAEGYVHTPSEAGEAPALESSASTASIASRESTDATKRSPSDTDEFGRAGWALTGVLIVCMLIIPGIIYLYPYFLGSFGLSFFSTYLVLPLIPAGVLGLVAVWSMTAAVHDE